MEKKLKFDSDFLARLEALKLSARWVRWGNRIGGRFIINRRGSSIEFADYAPYITGDDIQDIDWNLYARLDRLFVRTYKEEIELSVDVIVDATASMLLPDARKFERSVELALCLSYIALAGKHQVRLSFIKPGRLLSSPRFIHRSDLSRISDFADSVRPEGSANLSEWMQRSSAALRMRGGQAILISDCLHYHADWFRTMYLLMKRHLEVKVVQVISVQELNPVKLMKSGVLVDSETGHTHELYYSAGELSQAVREHNETMARFCKKHGIPFAQYKVEDNLDSFVLKALPARGFLE
jgi:uncharacterized protein (DUF58 family)